jgi:transcriptional regulator with XRE-family HTH domain
MAKRGDPGILRLVVIFLRSYADMTQTELGKAARVDQGLISRYESGKQSPPEEILRRMAAAAGFPWPLVAHLRRFYAAVLSTAARQSATAESPLPANLPEPVLLALTPYWVEEGAAAPDRRTSEEERQEAEAVWTALRPFPSHQRQRMMELSVRAARNRALAEKISHESVRAAAHRTEDALELAELARFVARRMAGEEG